jgi:polysaccharide chain length determinant protein (PEP-CTERM system associated)
MKIGLTTSQDFLALLVRRRWWVIAPFIALSLAGATLTHFLPKSYVSETLILVRPRDVPKDFVKDLISGTPQERLKAIEQTVLSRTNLLQILREFGDNLPELARLDLDQRVVALRSQIHIDFNIEKSGGTELPLTYFRITYRNQSPELAQKIASKLTTLFIEQDNQVRETQVFGTTEFLAAELEKITQQLDDSEAKLKEVKSSRQFELPDQRDANLRTLDRLGLDKKTNSEALDRQLTIRLNLERELSDTPATLPKQTQIVSAFGVPVTVAVNPKLEAYRKADQEYADLSARYTSKHPEVLAAKARLDRLKEQLPPALLAAVSDQTPANSPAHTTSTSNPAPTSNATPPSTQGAVESNPLYVRLQSQLAEVKTELAIRQKEKAWIEAEIAKYTRRVEDTPKTEQDIADVQRQTDDLKKQYEDLKGKLSQARLSESLESKQKGSQFVIVDPANYPLDPDKPNKTAVFLATCAISLLISIALATGIDIVRQKVWTHSQIEALWGLPVLVEIPEIVTDSDLATARARNFRFLMASMAGALVYAGCLYGVYLKHNFILTQLDPLLQKLIYKQ